MSFWAAKKRKQQEQDEDFAGVPRFAIENDQPRGTWSTYDADTKQVDYDAQWQGGNKDDGRLWVDRAGDDNNESFDQKFVADADLLRNRPANAFEARNASVLPINMNWANIRTVHGNIKISEDDRISGMQSDGTYQDPQQRGRPKKRYVKEWQKRFDEREEEKAVWREKVDRWKALSEEERDRRRIEARDNLRVLMEHFHLTEVDSIPEDYAGGAFEMSELANALDDTASDTTSVASEPSAGTASAWSRSSYSRDTPDGLQQVSRGSQQLFHRTIEARTARGFQATPQPSSLKSPSSFTLTYRPRAAPITFRSFPTQTPIPRPEIDWSQFSVINHPDYIPFEDMVSARHYANDEREAKVKRIADLSMRKGRVITVRLGDGISTSFSEAVSDRLFGGLIQEIQFFPDNRHAVICFLTPVAAAAFIRHIYNTRHNSQHEYKRLEIAATWYQGSEKCSIFPAQEEILRAVVYETASRVLLINGIEKTWVLHDFNDQMKREFGLTRLIVKGRLVVPTKVYERERQWSSSIILEMASIRDAIDLKDTINANGLPKNPHARAEFTKDSVDSPGIMRPWCDCKYCKAQRRAAP